MENEYPRRKRTRLENYDYSTSGAYFITICTENRKNTLATIVPVGEGFPLPPLTKLSRNGEIVEKRIKEISEKYPEISVDAYVIMPNHIHLLMSVICKTDCGTSCENGRGDPSPTIGTVIGWLKYHVTKEINQISNSRGKKIFQRSYYDHVVRNASGIKA